MNKYQRSTDYRRRFLKYNKGVFGGGNFFCSYCGRLLTPRRMTVDHLIPVNKVKKRGFARTIMKIKGINNISDKMGIWILRGNIGRHPWFWILKKSLVLAASIILIYTYRNEMAMWLKSIIDTIKEFLDKI